MEKKWIVKIYLTYTKKSSILYLITRVTLLVIRGSWYERDMLITYLFFVCKNKRAVDQAAPKIDFAIYLTLLVWLSLFELFFNISCINKQIKSYDVMIWIPPFLDFLCKRIGAIISQNILKHNMFHSFAYNFHATLICKLCKFVL